MTISSPIPPATRHTVCRACLTAFPVSPESKIPDFCSPQCKQTFLKAQVLAKAFGAPVGILPQGALLQHGAATLHPAGLSRHNLRIDPILEPAPPRPAEPFPIPSFGQRLSPIALPEASLHIRRQPE